MKIVIFGVGNYTIQRWNDILEQFDVYAAIDNKVERGNYQVFNGIKIFNPFDFSAITQYPVIVMMHDYKSAVIQLKKLKCSDKNIWIYNDNINGKLSFFSFEDINHVINLPNEEIGSDWGYRRGTPVGRVYIDMFLNKYRECIRGDIMEVAETTYSERFCQKNDTTSFTAIHVEKKEGCRQANLETGEGFYKEEFDTMIITQTLAYIYNLNEVINTIYRSLKQGGHCFVTVTDIGHMGSIETEKYGAFWGFHRAGIAKLFTEVFGENNVMIESYGNLKTVVAQLYGICAEDLDKKIINKKDDRYPMIIGIVARKV